MPGMASITTAAVPKPAASNVTNSAYTGSPSPAPKGAGTTQTAAKANTGSGMTSYAGNSGSVTAKSVSGGNTAIDRIPLGSSTGSAYTSCHNTPIKYVDPTGHTVLKVGSKGDDVKALQQKLKDAGYKIRVDGNFGPKTEAALKDYQKNHGLKDDGIAGPKTMASLNSKTPLTQSQSSAKPANPTPALKSSTLIPETSTSTQSSSRPSNEFIKEDDVTITYRAGAVSSVISSYSINMVKKITSKSGNDTVEITRTIATPESQANTMYNNLKRTGVEYQRKVYGNSGGSKVIDTYVASTNAGKTAVQIKADMAKTINEVGPSSVSKHCYTKEQYKELNTFDINKYNLDNPEAFEKLLKEAQKDGKLKYLNENGCFHIQINQLKK